MIHTCTYQKLYKDSSEKFHDVLEKLIKQNEKVGSLETIIKDKDSQLKSFKDSQLNSFEVLKTCYENEKMELNKQINYIKASHYQREADLNNQIKIAKQETIDAKTQLVASQTIIQKTCTELQIEKENNLYNTRTIEELNVQISELKKMVAELINQNEMQQKKHSREINSLTEEHHQEIKTKLAILFEKLKIDLNPSASITSDESSDDAG